jgi:3-phosphoshikimate 1-carboxyvinyltransferase
MGGAVERLGSATWMGEPVGDLVVRPARLRATRVTANEIPGLIDEIPMLAVLASRAEGTTIFDQVGELRVKESNRLALLAANLTAVGVEAHASENRLTVVGTDRPPRGRVTTEGDHRLAMAFAVLGTITGARVEVDSPASVDVSFPEFFETLKAIGGRR